MIEIYDQFIKITSFPTWRSYMFESNFVHRIYIFVLIEVLKVHKVKIKQDKIFNI